MPRPPHLLIAALLPALAACAAAGERAGAWEKPGMSDAAKAAAMRDCREHALERAGSRAVRHVEEQHSRNVAAQDLTRNDEMAGLRRLQEADRIALERRFFDECMRANGYRRVGAG